MKECSIDAVYHGEERYAKLSLAYSTAAQQQEIESALEGALEGFSLKPNVYTSTISGGRTVMVIEFHDDYDRESGAVFDKILGTLGITACE